MIDLFYMIDLHLMMYMLDKDIEEEVSSRTYPSSVTACYDLHSLAII